MPDVTDFKELPNYIFEATYKSCVFSYPEFGGREDGVKQYDVMSHVDYTLFGGEVYLSDYFGHNVRTVYTTHGNMYNGYLQTETMCQFWATENGLFQNLRNRSYYSGNGYQHYLDGVQINKITSIYGLTAFGTYDYPGLAKESILIGADDGLYFSSSIYWKSIYSGVNTHKYFHYDEFGNKKINDIAVNYIIGSGERYANNNYYGGNPGCEDGVWLAAIDGLYFIKPDYGKYINTQTLDALRFKNDYSGATEKEICNGQSETIELGQFVYSNNNVHNNTVQWYKNDQPIVNQTQLDLVVNQAGDYYAIMYDPCSGTHVESNRLKIKVTDAPSFTFNYPDNITSCAGTSVELKATGSPGYKYRWYKDGVVTGNTTNTLNTTESGIYNMEVSACDGSWVPSKAVNVKFIDLPVPVVKSDRPAYCIGDKASLSVNVPLDAAYTITWLNSGVPVNGSVNKTAIETDAAGSYTLEISSKEITCGKASAPLPVSFDAKPTIAIENTSTGTFCDGQTISLKANYSAGVVKWNNGATTDIINVSSTGTYTATVTTTAGCEVSANYDVQILPNPVLNVADAQLCEFTKETVTLTAPAGLKNYVWNGVGGTQTYTTGKLGPVTLLVTDANGCTASQTINITSYCVDIHLPNTFTPNGDGVNDTWVITGLADDPTVTVKVFNRYGSAVLNSKGYAAPWRGEHLGKKLPAGTYYYIITAKAGKQTLSGSVTIMY